MRLLVTKIVLLFALVFGKQAALAQASPAASGLVRDARTQQPLSFASVFLANTTYGTTTDSTGHFVLGNVPAGQYELTISHVGYELVKQLVTLPLAAPLTLALRPVDVSLAEVTVRPAKNRPADYQRFVKQFLGGTTLSERCHIENPQDVLVLYDKSTRELTALAPRNLRVINQALGYRITYYNFSFKINYATNRCVFVAVPLFEELPSTSTEQQQHWQESRRRAYAGSLPHFLRSMRENRLVQEGFLVRRLVRGASTEQLHQRLIRASDSLVAVFAAEPGVTARVYKQPLSAAQICRFEAGTTRAQLRFSDALQVTYQNELPDPIYTAFINVATSSNAQIDLSSSRMVASRGNAPLGQAITKPTAVLEVSELRLLGPEAVVLPNGSLRNPLSVQVDGYWGFEKVGEALPLDYTPGPGH
jgi:hypothetical protein